MSTPSRTLHILSCPISDIKDNGKLVPARLEGNEGIDTLFCYTLTMRGADIRINGSSQASDFDTSTWIGQEISIGIDLDGHGTREINGLITHVGYVNGQDWQTTYTLTIRPWLYLATLDSDAAIYQDKTVIDIIDDILSTYPYQTEKKLTHLEQYPVRDYQTRFNESTFAFFSRLCEENGIYFWFTHEKNKHKLVLSDQATSHQPLPNDAWKTIEYHPQGETGNRHDAEFIDTFSTTEQLVTGKYATGDYDYMQPGADLIAAEEKSGNAIHKDAEFFQWPADVSQPKAGNKHSNDTNEEGRNIARMRLEALHRNHYIAHGSGPLRYMLPGHTFTLKQHPRSVCNIQWLIRDAALLIEETNTDSQSNAESFTVKTTFHVQPADKPYRPALVTPKPLIHGPQTAVVVGPQGKGEIWTDAHGRIKVHLFWDRKGSRNENSSCWVRVSSPWQGNQYGAVQLPRIGQEVIVSFINGDPDLPIVTGRVANAQQMPPWQLPTQHALSGIRSKELAGNKTNHLLFDDTTSKVQAQLRSDHMESQLSLGHITRIEGTAGRKDERGEGFELRTDGNGAIRAQGLLISTDDHNSATSNIMKRKEITGFIQHGSSIASSLSAAIKDHGGHAHATEGQKALAESVESMGYGKASETGKKATAKTAIVAISAPDGIVTASAKDQMHYADENLHHVSGKNIQQYANEHILQTAKKDIEHYAIEGDLKQISNKGKVVIQAQNEAMEMTAKKQIKVTAIEEEVHILSGKKITLQVGESFISITPDKITIDSKNIDFQSNNRNFKAQEGMSSKLPKFELSEVKENLQFVHEGGESINAKDYDYFIQKANGETLKGKLDSNGLLKLNK